MKKKVVPILLFILFKSSEQGADYYSAKEKED